MEQKKTWKFKHPFVECGTILAVVFAPPLLEYVSLIVTSELLWNWSWSTSISIITVLIIVSIMNIIAYWCYWYPLLITTTTAIVVLLAVVSTIVLLYVGDHHHSSRLLLASIFPINGIDIPCCWWYVPCWWLVLSTSSQSNIPNDCYHLLPIIISYYSIPV